MRNKLLIALIGIIVIVIVAALIIPLFLDVNRYKGQIQAELEQRLNRPVSLGQMKLSLLPPSFEVSNPVIGEDKAFQTGRAFATAQELSISLKFWPLLTGKFDVNSIELKRPNVELVRNKQGVWNFASLGNRTVTGATTPAPQPKTSASEQRFSLNELVLKDGTVAVTDLEKSQARSIYDHIDLTLQNFEPGKPFDLELAAHLPGQGQQLISLKGHGGPIDDASMVSTPFDGKLSLNEVSLDGLQKFLNSPALKGMGATISGDASVKNKGGVVSSDGTINVQDAVVHGNKIGYPITVDYDVSNDLNNETVQIGHANLKLGKTPVSISGSINNKPTPALLNVQLNAGDISIAEVARLASAFGYAFNPDMQVEGRLKGNIQAQGSTASPVLNGTVEVQDVVVSGKDLPQPVRVPQVQVALAPDLIKTGNFQASTNGTTVTSRLEVRQYATKSPLIQASVQVPETELSNVLAIAHGLGISALNGISGNGRFALNVNADGPVKNMNAVKFSGTGSLRNASLRMPQLTQPLTIQNAAMSFSQNGVAIDGFAGSLGSTHANGRVSIQNFLAPKISLALNADTVNTLELQKLVAGNAQQPNSTEPSLLTKATGTGTVNIGTLTYDQLILKNLHSNIAIDHGLIKLAPVTASVAGGQTTGSITIDMRGPETQYAIAMNAQKLEANQLLSSVSSVKNTLYGLLTSNMNAQFQSVPSGQDIAKTLNGRVSLNLSNGKIAGVDFMQRLGSVAGFQTLGQSANAMTQLQKLTGNFDVQNGVATTNDLRADLGAGNLAAAGSMNLVDNSINMKVTAVLDQNYSQQIGGTKIGGFMQTALANNRGELVIPVIVTGSLQAPKVVPDLQTLAQMKLQNLLPTAQNPGALGSVLSGVLGGKQQQNGAKQQNPLGQILGGLAGQQQQQQPPQQQQQQQPQQGQSQPQSQQQKGVGGAINDALNSLFGSKKKQQQQQNPPQQQPQQQSPQQQ